jgi:hypothetical protein
MNSKRLAALFGCLACAVLAYTSFDYWRLRNGPMTKRFESQWEADVKQLEDSQKLPKAWFEVKEFNVIAGNPETRKLLRSIELPFRANPHGKFKLDVLMVAWEEPLRTGVLIQYNLEDLRTKNTVFELNRNLVLPRR